jgi:hypothetical protein
MRRGGCVAHFKKALAKNVANAFAVLNRIESASVFSFRTPSIASYAFKRVNSTPDTSVFSIWPPAAPR